MASIAVFLVLSGGTAVALSGSNTVFSDDIVDGEVQNGDLGSNAVSGSKVFPSSLTGSDVAPSGLTGSDVAADSLTSSDIGAGAVGTAEQATSIPAARISRPSFQGVTPSTDTTVNFTSEAYDTASMHSTAHLSRLTVPVTGIYELGAHVNWDLNFSGYRVARLIRNGSPNSLAEEAIDASVPADQNVTTVERLTAGDYVEVDVYQTSGNTRNLTAELSITWLAPGP
jgi:hypothetical protein